jgi:hypothetical protein
LEGNCIVAWRSQQPAEKRGKVVSLISNESGVPESECHAILIKMLLWISMVNQTILDAHSPYTVLPFKLHQFIAQTGSVHTTLEQADRLITLEPGIYKEDDESKKPIFANVFSRASGHPYICVSRIGSRLEPREFRESTEEAESTDGYLLLGEDIWNPETDYDFLPDARLRVTRVGIVAHPDKLAYFPSRIYFDKFGNCSDRESLKYAGWFMPAPLLFEPTGEVFFHSKTSEGTKLTKLGSEGRSTSTTITAFSILNQLHDAGYLSRDQKLLSFTDNRQDAALQAGHFQ